MTPGGGVPSLNLALERCAKLALPRAIAQPNSLLMVSIPSTTFPSLQEDIKPGLLVGQLQLFRPAQVSGQRLEPGAYTMRFEGDSMGFLASNGEVVRRVPARVETLNGVLKSPKTSISLRNVCYRWSNFQICMDIGAENIFSEASNSELNARWRDYRDSRMSEAISRLSQLSLITSGVININGALPAVEGIVVQKDNVASLLVAPVSNPIKALKWGPEIIQFASNHVLQAETVLGVARVVEPIVRDPEPPIPTGAYLISVLPTTGDAGTAVLRGVVERSNGTWEDTKSEFKVDAQRIPVTEASTATPPVVQLSTVQIDGWCLSFSKGLFPC